MMTFTRNPAAVQTRALVRSLESPESSERALVPARTPDIGTQPRHTRRARMDERRWSLAAPQSPRWKAVCKNQDFCTESISLVRQHLFCAEYMCIISV